MIGGYRVTRFQLTPLMDLLLIIVFAQFLEVREATRVQTDQLAAQRQSLTDRIASERAELEGIRRAIESEGQLLRQQRDGARAARDTAVAESKLAAEQTARSLTDVARWLAIDETAVRQFGIGGDRQAALSREEALDQSGELAESSPATVLRFLISHAELLKRAEVWTVHATARGEVQLIAGERIESFRLEAREQEARMTEVADRLFAAYKRLPQPKGLVILLVSYDPRSVAGVYQPLVDAVPATLERWRADTPMTRFEYTVLGTAPAPDVSVFDRGPSP